MFDDKENLIGVLLLAVCGVVAGVLVWQIMTGNRLTYTGPSWIPPILMLFFLGVSFYGIFAAVRSRRGGGGSEQWPSPQTGRRSWWDRLRGR